MSLPSLLPTKLRRLQAPKAMEIATLHGNSGAPAYSCCRQPPTRMRWKGSRQMTHLSHSSEKGWGSATWSGSCPSIFCVPPGTRCGRSRSSAAPAAARRPVGNTRVPASRTGCESEAATATGGICWTRRSACPGTGGRGSASGCASRSASSACTCSGGAAWTRTWTCSSFGAGSDSATTPGSSRWSGTESSQKTSGSWTPRTGGWTGPTETSRGTPCPAASRATGRSRTETSRPEAANFPPSLRIPTRKLGA